MRFDEENAPSEGPGSPVVIAFGVVALAAMVLGLAIGLLI